MSRALIQVNTASYALIWLSLVSEMHNSYCHLCHVQCHINLFSVTYVSSYAVNTILFVSLRHLRQLHWHGQAAYGGLPVHSGGGPPDPHADRRSVCARGTGATNRHAACPEIARMPRRGGGPLRIYASTIGAISSARAACINLISNRV